MGGIDGTLFTSYVAKFSEYVYSFLFIWILGSLISLILYSKYEYSASRLSKEIPRINDPKIIRILKSCEDELRVRHPVEIGTIQDIVTPCLFETIGNEPIIILPDTELDERRLRLIFPHELMHLQYRDIVIKRLCRIIQAIYWWNPLVYVLGAQLDEGCELTCDYRVLKGRPIEERYNYSQAVLDFARASTQQKAEYNIIAFGGKAFKRRVKFMLRPEQKVYKWYAICCAVILFSLSFLSFRSAMPVETQKDIDLSNDYEIVARPDGFYDLYSDGQLIIYGADENAIENIINRGKVK
ncbi:hypothetical protein SDC9_134023 [bioreactor metagenome]|uniref:Peptidase M56 domain-containing protein n=1 Tax=bioreactor metagenome TaxID=1076179 RepID=A0A645DBT0_9ZZZZ